MNNQKNVDPHEINQFAQQAEQWWDRNGNMKALHAINPTRLDYIQQHATLQGQRVLDVGCGGGILSESLAAQGAQVTGIDLTAELISVAQQHANQQGLSIDYQHLACSELAGEHPQTFDVITCMELLEHVPDPAALINDCVRLVKPNGTVFFSTINRNLKSFLAAIIGAEYVLNLIPRGTHSYQKLIRPSELINWSEQAGLDLKDLSGMSFNPFTHQAQLTQDVSINYQCCFTKPAQNHD